MARLCAAPSPAGQKQGEHLLAVYDPDLGTVLAQRKVGDKTNEIPLARELLAELDLQHTIVTADAMHTQTAFCEQVLAQGGDYLLTVKKNQPNLLAEISYLFATEQAGSQGVDFVSSVATNKGHGRVETRRLTSSTMLNGYTQWPGLSQVYKIERVCWRLDGSLLREETGYGVTSLARKYGTPARLSGWLRGHWNIENGLHYRRDKTLLEDQCRQKPQHAGQTLAVLNNVVVGLVGKRNLAAARREYAARPYKALQLLTSNL